MRHTLTLDPAGSIGRYQWFPLADGTYGLASVATSPVDAADPNMLAHGTLPEVQLYARALVLCDRLDGIYSDTPIGA